MAGAPQALLSGKVDGEARAAATLLKGKAWGNTGVRWVDSSNATCSDPLRETWITQRLVQDVAPSLTAQGIDVTSHAQCLAGYTSVDYKLRTTTGTAAVSLAAVGGGAGVKIIGISGTASTNPSSKNFNQIGGLERLVAWSDTSFTLEFVACAP